MDALSLCNTLSVPSHRDLRWIGTPKSLDLRCIGTPKSRHAKLLWAIPLACGVCRSHGVLVGYTNHVGYMWGTKITWGTCGVCRSRSTALTAEMLSHHSQVRSCLAHAAFNSTRPNTSCQSVLFTLVCNLRIISCQVDNPYWHATYILYPAKCRIQTCMQPTYYIQPSVQSKLACTLCIMSRQV